MEALLPSVAMVLAILAQVGSMELNKAAMSRGTDKYVLIVYSNAIASFILLPLAFIFHGSVRLPAVRSFTFFRVFLLAIIGSASQLCGYTGIQYSSPALGTAMLNLIPAFTFTLALTFRMEKLDLRSRSGKAKSLGTLVSILGALVATLYQGPPVLRPLLTSSSYPIPSLFSAQLSWIIGGVLLAAEALTISAWYILQTMILRDFPAIFTVMFYLCFFNAALSAAYSVILVEDRRAWTPRQDLGLVAIMYHGIVATVFRIGLVSWCLSRVGPLFVSMFKPVAIIFAVALGVSFLGETLFLGSLVGAAIIVCGFYAVLWGKVKEAKMINEGNTKSAGQKVPLLQNRDEETRCAA